MVALSQIFKGPSTPDLSQILTGGRGAFEAGQAQSQAALAGEAQAQKAQDVQDTLNLLETGGAKNEQDALARLATLLGAPVANSVRESLERGDKNELLELDRESTKANQIATFLGGIKDPAKRNNAIAQEAQRAAANGEDIGELVKLRNMTPEQQAMAIERQRVTSTDTADLAKERLKRIEFAEQAAQPGDPFTLSPGQQRFGPGGAPIAQVDPKAPTTPALQQNLIAAGFQPGTPQFQQELLKAIQKPATQIDINKANQGLFKLEPGTMLLDPNDPTKGVKPVPGGSKDTLKGEQAAKVQMLRTARKAAKGIRKLIFDKDGNIDTLNLINAAINLPGSDGRLLRTRMEFGIQAITRGETGAAMPPEEVENTRLRFMPSALDSKEIVKLKLEMFNDFLGGTLKLIDPTDRFFEERFVPDDGIDPGLRFDDEKFDAELEKRVKKSGITVEVVATPIEPGAAPAPAQAPKTPNKIGRFTIKVK